MKVKLSRIPIMLVLVSLVMASQFADLEICLANDDVNANSNISKEEITNNNAVGGRDVFGYTLDESEPFDWIDVSSGTDTGLTSADHVTEAISIPFNFSFYGNIYNKVYIQSHGCLSFTDTTYTYTWSFDSKIPDPAKPNNVIAPYWGPNFLSPSGWVRYTSGGNIPNQYFIIEWHDLTFYAGNSFTFQTILYENGDIVFQYGPMLTGGSMVACAMGGIENITGKDGLAYLNFCGWPTPYEAVRSLTPDPNTWNYAFLPPITE